MEDENYIGFSSFESVEDFLFSLTHGREIMFCYKRVDYSAFRESDNLYTVLESGKLDTIIHYESEFEVLDFIIQNKPLKEIITQVEVLHRNI